MSGLPGEAAVAELTYDELWSLSTDDRERLAGITEADKKWIADYEVGKPQLPPGAGCTALAEKYWKGDGVPPCRRKAIGLAYQYVEAARMAPSWANWDEPAEIDAIITECRQGGAFALRGLAFSWGALRRNFGCAASPCESPGGLPFHPVPHVMKHSAYGAQL